MRLLADIANILRAMKAGPALFVAATLCQVATPVCAAAPRVAEEYDLKAAFLFNLAKFIQWPPAKFDHDDSPLIFGVLGDEALDRFTRLLQDKAIDKRKLVVRRLDQARDLPACHILFISRAENERVAELTDAARNSAVLTVGETDQFLESGGIIKFTIESDTLRLEINDQLARRAGLNISASALSALVNKGIAKIRNL